ncbi:retrotransposon protein, putative, ty1-copia subclass [Tanacetum coccineum]
MAFAGQIVNNLTFRYFLEKEKLPDPNFLDRYRNLSIVLTYLEHPIPAAPVPVTPKQRITVDILAAYTRWVKASKEIACLMLVSMTLDLQKNLEHFVAFDMLLELKTIGKIINQLHSMLKLHEKGLPKKDATPVVLVIKVYETSCGAHSCNTTQGLNGSKKLKPGALNMYTGNGHRAAVEAIRSSDFILPNGLCIVSARTHRALDQLCLYVDAKEHELGDHNEPSNYKASLSDPESNKWLEAMNVEMKFMKDNQVWDLVDLPLNAKTVGSKWLFKKKTYMYGKEHTYKACLVAKVITQTYRVDYEEIFSSVADIRAIRIFIAIVAYYDYKILQMDVKTAFFNEHLTEEVYMVQPEGFVNPKYPNCV